MKKKTRTEKRSGRFLKRALIALVALVAVYVALCLFLGQLLYPAFYRSASFGQAFADRGAGFVPQGVTQTASGETLVCGYMNGKGASRLYVYAPDGQQKTILLQTETGEAYTGHAGGVTAAGDWVYISNAHKLFVLPLSDVLEAADGGTLAFRGHADVPVNASYCSSADGMLYVGEYHDVGYETDAGHSVATAGGTYQALTFGYKLDPNGEFGLARPAAPVVAYATPDSAQGFAVLPDGRVAVSCSHGFRDSHLYLYDGKAEPDGTFFLTAENSSVPLIILDETRLRQDLKMPRMSEDLDYRDGALMLGFESGALKFGAGLLPLSVRRIAVIEADTL